MSRKKRGFTLLELIIVIIVIGILASIALPRFMRVTEKARTAEAKSSLAVLRASQIRYYAQWAVYTSSYSKLDTQPDVKFFNYTAQDGLNNNIVATAERTDEQGSDDYNITITHDGVLDITSGFDYLL